VKKLYVAGIGVLAIAVVAIPAACQRFAESAAKQAREHAVENVRKSAESMLTAMNSDPGVRNADPEISAKNAARYLSPPHAADTVIKGPGFEVRTQLDEPWRSSSQEHRVRLCVSYVSSDSRSDPVRVVDRPCAPDVLFIPGLDDIVTLHDH
jgi:hypothetical protein